MRWCFATLCLVVGPALAVDHPPPHVSFIDVRTISSSWPGIYIDEWGNARIEAWCRPEHHVDVKLDPKRFKEAKQLLENIAFRTLASDPTYEYEGPKDKRTFHSWECRDCASYTVTLNDGVRSRSYTVTFDAVEINKSRIAAIQQMLDLVTKGKEPMLCKSE